MQQSELLTYEELLRIISVGAGLGISKIRLTGGEPLVRDWLLSFIRKLAKIEGIQEIVLTTNGILLAKYASELRKSGVSRVNVSLDTLDDARYEDLTGGGRLCNVIAGIDAALEAGLHPLKLNTVLHCDMGMDDIYALIEFARSRNVTLRFIELMPLLHSESTSARQWKDMFVSAEEIRARLGDRDIKHAEFISSVSRPFCNVCNRLRLTADGKILACIRRGAAIDIKHLVRNGANRVSILQAFNDCLALKPKPWHSWGEHEPVERVSAIGG
jgi:cyclic pyranopterin phosphate synthase